MAKVPKRYIFVLFAFTGTMICLIDRVNLSVVAPVLMKEYNWSPVMVGTVLSAFYWGYSLSPIPGGWLADRLGGKRVLGFGAAWWSLCTILTPLAPGHAGFLAIRALLGLGEGVNAPATQSLASRWLPSHERTRGIALSYSGSSVGTIIAFPLTTLIITTLGWHAVFYIYGVVGLVWVGLWHLFGASSPETHPTISDEERRYIDLHRGPQKERGGGVPWRTLLSKRPVWGLVLTTFSVAWVVWLLLSWLPTYLIEAHHFSLKQSGIYSTLPFLANIIGHNLFGWVQDRLITLGYSVTLVRKASVTFAFAGTTTLLLLISRASNAMEAVWLLTAAMAIFAGSQVTVMVNNLDIAPRHAGVVFGLQATAGNLAGAISPVVAGLILSRTGSFNAVFYVIAGLLIVSGFLWNLLASGDKVID
jgi:MFS transporter, ACS family, solute carrier family 17 (sodium-dependent inorganic phosphate cotransporter), other